MKIFLQNVNMNILVIYFYYLLAYVEVYRKYFNNYFNEKKDFTIEPKVKNNMFSPAFKGSKITALQQVLLFARRKQMHNLNENCK
jgi:hypothetical protein